MSEELKAEIANLKKQLAEEQSRSLHSEVMAELSKESHRIRNAGQFFKLFIADGLSRDSAGHAVVNSDGIELPIARVIDSIKGDPENQHHFVQPEKSSSKGDGPVTNPWMPGSINLTRQGQILRSNPALAEKMQQQAKAAKQAG